MRKEFLICLIGGIAGGTAGITAAVAWNNSADFSRFEQEAAIRRRLGAQEDRLERLAKTATRLEAHIAGSFHSNMESRNRSSSDGSATNEILTEKELGKTADGNAKAESGKDPLLSGSLKEEIRDEVRRFLRKRDVEMMVDPVKRTEELKQGIVEWVADEMKWNEKQRTEVFDVFKQWNKREEEAHQDLIRELTGGGSLLDLTRGGYDMEAYRRRSGELRQNLMYQLDSELQRVLTPEQMSRYKQSRWAGLEGELAGLLEAEVIREADATLLMDGFLGNRGE